jgi:DNA-nicking Smr family endonuclease
MSRRRHLRPEEQEIWNTVARTATPMHQRQVFTPQPDAVPAPEFTPPFETAAVLPKLPKFNIGQAAKPAPNDFAAKTPPLRMDAKKHAKMTRGKLAPEARIDLHGMTVAQAHPALTSFILNAYGAGMRLVLVITGKGKTKADHGPIPQRMGVLRQQVPNWLDMPPLSSAILQVTEAHATHGGGGALYVYLRRR